jgi:hypothetical protein
MSTVTCPNCLPAGFPNARPDGPYAAASGAQMLAHIEADHPWMLHGRGLICGTCWRNVTERACTHYDAYGRPLAVSALWASAFTGFSVTG